MTARRAALGAIVVLLCAAVPALAEMVQGSYTGDGTTGRTIDGLGFQPDVVIVKGGNAASAVIRGSWMTGDNSKSMTDETGVFGDAITNLTADGFEVGSIASVNANGVEYQWIAFREVPGQLFTSWYIGNGVEGQYWGIGFQPEMVIIVPHGNQRCQFRTIDMPDYRSTTFVSDGMHSNRLQLFVAGGFLTGNDATVNAVGEQYGIIAWNSSAPDFSHGTYIGDGNNGRSVAGTGFQPDWLVVKSEESQPAVHRPQTLGNPWSAWFTDQPHVDDAVIDLAGNGFRVGDNPAVNEAGKTFYYAAFDYPDGSADIAVSVGVDDATPDEGQEITYTVQATNNGPDEAAFLSLSAVLPTGLTYTGDSTATGSYDDATGLWAVGTLANGDTATLTLTATVDVGTEGQVLTLPVSVAGLAQADPNGTNDTDSVDVTVNVNSTDLAITLNVDDAAPELGDTVTLTATITNQGPADVTDGTLVVDLPADLTEQTFVPDAGATDSSTPTQINLAWAIPAGESRQVVATYRIDRGAVTRTFDGAVSSSVTDTDGANDAAQSDLTIPSADLAVTLAADDTTPPAGGTLQLTVGLDNGGPDDAPTPSVAVVVPAGLTVTGAAPGAGTYDIPTGMWAPGALASGGHVELVLDVAVAADQAGASLSVSAAAGSARNDQTAGNDADTVAIDPVAVSDLGVTAAFDAASALTGDTVDLTVTVTNDGPGDTAWLNADITTPAGLTYQSHLAGAGTFDGGTGAWLQSLPVAAGASETLVVTYLVTGVDAGPVSATAAVNGPGLDPVSGNNSAAVSLDLTGSFDYAPTVVFDPATADAGDVVTMRVILDNAGPGRGPDYTVTVTTPGAFTYLDHTAGAGSYTSGTGQWAVADSLAAGQADTLAIRLTTPAAGSGSYTGNAAVPDLPGDTTPGNNTAGGSVTLAPVADLAVTAVAAPSTAWPGDAVTLTVTVTNAGPGDAPGPVATVTLPTDLVYQGHTAEVGAFTAGTGQWNLAGALSAGTSRTLTVDLQVAPAAAGSLDGAVTVGDAGATDPALPDNTDLFAVVVGGAVPVTVEAVPFAASERTLLPGGAADDVLQLLVMNTGSHDETLAGLTIHNPVTGGADQTAQDGYWNGLELRSADDDVLGTGDFAGGTLTFTGLDLSLAAGDTLELTLQGAAGLDAPDGVELRPTVADAAALDIPGLVAVSGDWPVTAPGILTIDGMTAAQITLHEVDAEYFQIGSVRNLALDVTLPGNGGQPDELIKLNVVNVGNADYPDVITRVEAWADDGDGTFDPAVDDRIGELYWTGGRRFEASSLGQPVPAIGLRVFVTVDVAEDALGGSVRLSLPAGDDVGVGMASGNDGPIDEAVTNLLPQWVSATDRVIVTTSPLLPQLVAPGAERIPLLHLVARNLYADTRTVRRLRIRNVTAGEAGASQADLDGATAQLLIQRDANEDGILDGPEIDPVVASTTWEDGEAIFEGARWVLEPDQVSHLFITANVSLMGTADGDSLGAVIGTAGDLMFTDADVAVVGDWPLDCGVRYVVDGMVAEQIACPAVPPVSLTANEGPVLALDFTVPGNGYLDDTLQALLLENQGTAVPADIGALELYDDQNGNGIFEPGADPLLATFTSIDQDWLALDLDLAVPADGRRLFAGLTVAATPTDSATVRLSVPVEGLVMTSANDGPLHDAVVSPTSLLISTAPLLSNISFDLDRSTTEMTTIVTMHVQNVGGEDVESITPRDLAITGDGTATLVSGPQPASLDLDRSGGEGTFTWVFAGDTQGPVYMTGRCEGTSAIGGQPRGSLATSSAAHVILDPAMDLDLYPVANMPFSINRGQTGVVPMTLTLLNGGGPDRADLRLEQLVVTLDDGDGNPVVPADLLSHVTVNEGVNVYCDRWDLETAGQTMTLDLDPPVVVTASEPVTLGLRLDIAGDTEVDRFRIIIAGPDDLGVVDHTSSLARTVNLVDATFPVMSATGSIVSQATGLVVTAPVQPDLTAGAGQDDVTLLQLDLTASGDDSASEVKVGGFAVAVVDTLGQILPDVAARLDELWVEGPLLMHAVPVAADTVVVFELLPQITVPVGQTSVAVTVHGSLPDDPALGPLRLRLEPTATFDARDGNNAADVLVTYQPAQITGPTVTVQDPVQSVQLAVTGELPPVISLGAADVLAMTIDIVHPGPASTAAVQLDSLRLECLDINRQPQDPDEILDGCRIYLNGEDLAAPVVYHAQHLVIPLGEHSLAPLESIELQLRVDVEAAAPAGGFELVASLTCLTAHDVNLDLPVTMTAAPGYSLPAGSGLARLQPPSDDVIAGWSDRLPPLLSAGDERTEALRLVLTNPATVGAAPVELAGLVLRAADRHGSPLAAGAALGAVVIDVDGAPWAELTDPATADSTLTIAGMTPLLLDAGGEVVLTVSVSGRPGSDPDGLSLGVEDGDVLCVQPGSTTSVEVRPAAGLAFPFWTAAASLGAAGLSDSYINFPNPFAAGRDATRFAFNLAEPATVTLKIWTPRGESVITLLSDEQLAATLHQDILWDGRNGRGQAVRNGVYLAELKVRYESGGSERLLRKVAVVR